VKKAREWLLIFFEEWSEKSRALYAHDRFLITEITTGRSNQTERRFKHVVLTSF